MRTCWAGDCYDGFESVIREHDMVKARPGTYSTTATTIGDINKNITKPNVNPKTKHLFMS